jgi:hypothetical protein
MHKGDFPLCECIYFGEVGGCIACCLEREGIGENVRNCNIFCNFNV